MTRVASLTAVVIGWFATVTLLSESLDHPTYAIGTAAALAVWSLVVVVVVEAVRRRHEIERFAPVALTACAALFAVLAFDVVA